MVANDALEGALVDLVDIGAHSFQVDGRVEVLPLLAVVLLEVDLVDVQGEGGDIFEGDLDLSFLACTVVGRVGLVELEVLELLELFEIQVALLAYDVLLEGASGHGLDAVKLSPDVLLLDGALEDTDPVVLGHKLVHLVEDGLPDFLLVLEEPEPEVVLPALPLLDPALYRVEETVLVGESEEVECAAVVDYLREQTLLDDAEAVVYQYYVGGRDTLPGLKFTRELGVYERDHFLEALLPVQELFLAEKFRVNGFHHHFEFVPELLAEITEIDSEQMR